jgi:hypothetical protein
MQRAKTTLLMAALPKARIIWAHSSIVAHLVYASRDCIGTRKSDPKTILEKNIPAKLFAMSATGVGNTRQAGDTGIILKMRNISSLAHPTSSFNTALPRLETRLTRLREAATRKHDCFFVPQLMDTPLFEHDTTVTYDARIGKIFPYPGEPT